MKILEKSDVQLSHLSCCSSLRCFASLEIGFLREKMVQILSSSLSKRRSLLHGMATSDGSFVFDGRTVCGTYLRKAFRFSFTSQATARRIPAVDTNGL